MRMELRSREIDKIFKRRDRYEIPVWQREEVWSDDTKRKLIDTILRGWHLPKFYLVRTSDAPESWEVADGQQRLAAIFEFMAGELELSPDTAANFGGNTYSTLPPDTSDQFDDFKLDYEEILEAAEGEVEVYFTRLQLGMPLTSAERLNAQPSKLTDFIRELVQHPFFQKNVGVRNYRYSYFDICLKVAAIEVEGIDVTLRLPDLQRVLQSNANFSKESEVAKRMLSSLDLLHEHVFSGKSEILRTRSVIQSVITLTIYLMQRGMNPRQGSRLRIFIEDFVRQLSKEVELGRSAKGMDLLQFQNTISSNIVSGTRQRHEILLRRLLIAEPEFLQIIRQEDVENLKISTTISNHADDIRELVYEINTSYQGKHGEDLFKMTNNSSRALTLIGRPCHNLEEYGDFIDNLYFLVYEGSGNGSRLGTPFPDRAMDIKVLRTQVRHDVDHGDERDIRKKRRRAADTFKKYSGVSAPELVATSAFPVVQIRILQEVVQLLEELAATNPPAS